MGTRRAKERGFSLIELLISTAVMAVVVLITLSVLNASQRVTTAGNARHVATASVQSAIAMLRHDLMRTGASTAPSEAHFTVGAAPAGTAGNTNQRISFRWVTGFDVAAKATIWSPTYITYSYELAGGRLVRQEGDAPGNGAPVVIATDFDPDFSFTRNGDVLAIHMRITKEVAGGERIAVGCDDSIALRN